MKAARTVFLATLVLAVNLAAASPAGAGDDWPQWRYDAAHTDVSPGKMTGGLTLLWSRQLPAPQKAWPDTQYFMQFDKSYEPVAGEGLLFVPSNVSDRVTAYDLATGKERWRFYGEAPVRFAPVYYNAKVFFVCDDGFLYCVGAGDGKLVYKLRGGPDNRRGLGNGRLCSLWPARGAPVLADGVLYWAASIWPFMGTFIYAVEPDTGKVLWCNSGNGAMWGPQPHGGAFAFSGVSPQGYLAVANAQRLVVPNGRNIPGLFDRKTGAFLVSPMQSKWGGTDVRVLWGGVYVSGRRHSITSLGGSRGAAGFLADNNHIFRVDGRTGSIEGGELVHEQAPDPKGRMQTVEKLKPVWSSRLSPAMREISIKVGDHLYGPGPDGVILGAVLKAGGKADLDFQGKYEGTLWRVLAADGKLVVVTEEGRIYCYGRGGQGTSYGLEAAGLPAGGDGKWAAAARDVLRSCDATGGWCVSLGIGSGGLIDGVLRQSPTIHVIAIDSDAAKVDALRRRMDTAGLYGRRVTALVGDPFGYPLPAYVAHAVFSEDTVAAGFTVAGNRVEDLVRPIRPYGGTARLPGVPADWARKGNLDGATVSEAGGVVVIRRGGALPGAADWASQYADAANSVVSQDDRVKLPLGILWFGGNTHLDVLPRHGHGPSPQVVGGRLIIEGIDSLSARDAYTGRVLWKKTYQGFSNFGMYWDRSFNKNIYDRSYNQKHIPGANQYGANYVSSADRVYLISGTKILVIDAATGNLAKTFSLPEAEGQKPNFGMVVLCGNVLLAAVEPIVISGQIKKGQQPAPAEGKFRLKGVAGVSSNVPYASASRRLVAMDAATGKVLWERPAELSYRHNAIVASGGRAYVIDGFSGSQRQWLAVQRVPVPAGAVVAMDLKTGREIWKDARNVFGTWLGYSEARDILVQGGSASRDRASDETQKGLVAYKGTDGAIVWKDLERKHTGPIILHGDRIITNDGDGGEVFNLLTGKSQSRVHPLTGQDVPWTWQRLYGCNTAVAGKHVMLFRSAAAGYYDLNTLGGTGNFGGFKSGCTSNMIAADGILSVPDYTRTCTCAYQNQTSLAMVSMPDVETWTFNALPAPGAAPIVRIGINIGAPGDRMENGTMWLDIPSVGYKSPVVGVTLTPGNMPLVASGAATRGPRLFRMHSALVSGGPLTWVAASGAEGIEQIAVALAPGGQREKAYTVRLVFIEPDAVAAPGARVFDVSIQGQGVLTAFDVAKESGGSRRPLVREFKNVRVRDTLTVAFKAAKGQPVLCGLEAIAE